MKHLLTLAAALVATATATLPAGAQVSGHIGINIGPPAPLVERVPAAPGPGYVWRPGYWRWGGARYVWVGGNYIRRPYGRTAWIPGHWQRGPAGHWFFVRGHWS